MPTPGNPTPAPPPARVPPLLMPGIGPQPQATPPALPLPNDAQAMPMPGAPAMPTPPVGGAPVMPPVPLPRPDMVGAAAMKAVNNPDAAAAEMAATGREPPAPNTNTSATKSPPLVEELRRSLGEAVGALEAVQAPTPPQPPQPLSPGSGVGGQLSPQFLQLLLGMQNQGQIGPSLGQLLSY